MKRILLPAMVAGLTFTATGAAHAASATGTMGVSMEITAYCEVKAGGTISFSPVGAWWNAHVDSTNGTFDVQCTNGTAYQIGLDNGLNASGGVRRMNSGTEYLNYDLYTDSAGGTAWGNTVDTNTKQSQIGDGDVQNHQVFGRVPSGQTAPTPGTYTDTVTITITY
jgi:spore coat protein U-like protein